MNKRSRWYLLLVGLVVGICVSELIFLVAQKKVHYAYVGYCVSAHKLGIVKVSMLDECLNSASEWVYAEASRIQDPTLPPSLARLTFENDSLLSVFLSDYVRNISIDHLFKSEEIQLSNLYYQTALYANSLGYAEMIEPLLQRCISLSPQLSYCYIELAHWYNLQGDRERAMGVFDRCARLQYPADYCLLLKKEILEQNVSKEFGFLSDSMRVNFLRESK